LSDVAQTINSRKACLTTKPAASLAATSAGRPSSALRLASEEPALAGLAAAAEWSMPQAQAVVE
jgi:hypothetical protein